MSFIFIRLLFIFCCLKSEVKRQEKLLNVKPIESSLSFKLLIIFEHFVLKVSQPFIKETLWGRWLFTSSKVPIIQFYQKISQLNFQQNFQRKQILAQVERSINQPHQVFCQDLSSDITSDEVVKGDIEVCFPRPLYLYAYQRGGEKDKLS